MSNLVKLNIEHEGQNYQLWRQDEKGEPRVKDLDLGAWLELGRPRKIRELHKRYEADLASLGEVSPYRRERNARREAESAPAPMPLFGRAA